MEYQNYFYFGKLTKTFGSAGQVLLFPDVDDLTDYLKIDKLYVEIDNQLIPFFIRNLKVHGNQFVVTLNNINSMERATLLTGKKVFLPDEYLPELSGTRFYYHEIIGYEVTDVNFGAVGKVIKVIDLPQNPLFEIDSNGKKVLIPISGEIILQVDRKKRSITVEAPEGLIDLYLE